MITVIIPAYNEEATVGKVVRFARKYKYVTEILVVDDNSADATVTKAKAAGAKIITSSQLGKGASMKDGLEHATNEIVVFLDADINPYPRHSIKLLTEPIINNEADFVKATFSRNAGRVTELVAKPLLSIFFPELTKFSQPLSGMIAGKRSNLLQLEFPVDYGVDISILIDMHFQKARIMEKNIGRIVNNSKSWKALGKMSKEVAATITRKALQQDTHRVTVSELCGINLIQTQMESALQANLIGLNKLIVFDMDNTLLEGRFIDSFVKKIGKTQELESLRNQYADDGLLLSKKIACLMKGFTVADILSALKEIPVVNDAKKVIQYFKSKGFITGLISDSYRIVTAFLKEQLGLDFALSNELDFLNGKATGEIQVPSFFFRHNNSYCLHTNCKSHALCHIAEYYQIEIKNCIAVGDSLNDLCMIENAGIGVAYCPESDILSHKAAKVITEKSMRSLTEFAN
jgi:glucosyl-3-phosphoglycerate synthase